MSVNGCVYGVMDHSIVDLAPGSTNNGVFLDQGGCGGDPLGVGNGQWNEATNPGTAQSFTLKMIPSMAGRTLAAMDLRSHRLSMIAPEVQIRISVQHYQWSRNTRTRYWSLGQPPNRSCRAYEIYQNTIGSARDEHD